MYRYIIQAARILRPATISSYFNTAKIVSNDARQFSTLINNYTVPMPPLASPLNHSTFLGNKQILEISSNIMQTRTVTKFSLKKGKRKTVKAALKRFYRLEWGGWIRPKVGRHKKIWKKSLANQRRLRQHVFCNGTQSVMLDKMVTKFWKRPKYYVDDPYEPYHSREEFDKTRKKPIVRD